MPSPIAVPPKPTFFATPAEFRAWLDSHHASRTELWVGYHKKASGRPSITWPESVDEALCFGWIDGVRKSIDEDSYAIRFTPRKRDSTWSLVNLRRVEALTAEGRMAPAGRRAFEARKEERSGTYMYEQRAAAALSPSETRQFRSNRAAWSWFMTQPAGYRKLVAWWVVSAKRDDTRARRLATLIADAAAGRRLAGMQRPAKKAR